MKAKGVYLLAFGTVILQISLGQQSTTTKMRQLQCKTGINTEQTDLHLNLTKFCVVVDSEEVQDLQVTARITLGVKIKMKDRLRFLKPDKEAWVSILLDS